MVQQNSETYAAMNTVLYIKSNLAMIHAIHNTVAGVPIKFILEVLTYTTSCIVHVPLWPA